MFLSASFAHTEQTDISVLDSERLIAEFLFVNWRSSLRSFVNFDLSTLDEHTSVYSANFWLVVADHLAIWLLEAFAKTHKVSNSFWGDVCEQLVDDSVGFFFEREVHEGILPCLVLVDCLAVSLFSLVNVDLTRSIVSVLECEEGVVQELVCVTDVLFVIQIDKWACFMLVKDTFQWIGGLFEELFPLCLEELHAFSWDNTVELFFQFI